MGALKWIGYIVAAIGALTVLAGAGMFVIAIVFIGGAVLCGLALVGITALLIKDFCDHVLPGRKAK